MKIIARPTGFLLRGYDSEEPEWGDPWHWACYVQARGDTAYIEALTGDTVFGPDQLRTCDAELKRLGFKYREYTRGTGLTRRVEL